MGEAKQKQEKQKLCLNCMLCCKFIVIALAGADLDLCLTRGLSIFHSEKSNKSLVRIPHVCQQLDNGCKIYEDRPDNCRSYDGRQDPTLKEQCLWHKLGK
jgi:hypothetical protein